MQKFCRNSENRSRNFFLVSILSTTRNGFIFFRVVRESFLFSFFHFFLSKWAFRSKAWKVPQSKSCFQVVKLQFHKFLSFSVTVEMIKSQVLSLKICEELSAKQKSESQQILSLQIRPIKSRSGQFVKDFSHRKFVSLFFYYDRP